jgi:MFS superfamily sulfate permease-like transporter
MVVSFATDLLMGVGSGILLKILLHLLRQVPVQRLVRPSFLLSEAAREQVTVKINKVLIFTNVLPVLNAIEALPKTAHVTIDLREASFVDLTATERLQELQRVRTIAGGKVDIKSPVGNGRSLMAIVNRRIRN